MKNLLTTKILVLIFGLLCSPIFTNASNNETNQNINYMPRDEAFVFGHKFVAVNNGKLQLNITPEESENMGISPDDYKEITACMNLVNSQMANPNNKINPELSPTILRDILLEKAAKSYDKNSGRFLNFETTTYILLKHTKKGNDGSVITLTEDEAKNLGIEPAKYRGYCESLKRQKL